MDAAQRFARVRKDMEAVLYAADADAAAVRELEKRWPELVRTAFRDDAEAQSRLERLPSDDPARARVGLLELLNRPRRETLHTAAIANLIDPRLEGGSARLQAFLELVLKEDQVPTQLASAKVLAEQPYELRIAGKTFYPTPDLRIEVGSLVVIVENKVDDQDREKQLSSYAKAARMYHKDAELAFFYLTPDGEAPRQLDAPEWTGVSYRDLVLCWRAQLADDEAHGGRWPEAARAYLTTICRSICNWRPELARSRADRSRLLPYLRVATGALK